MKLSILIPVYNEENTILSVLERVNAQRDDDLDLQVVVVDDGSQDMTIKLLESRPELYDIFHKMEKNGGKGAAVKTGLGLCTADHVLFQDADEEYDPAEIKRLVMPVQRFGADIVMGSRMTGSEFTRVHYFWHRVGNHFITLLFNILHNTTFTDIYSCYLLFRRSYIDPAELKTLGWEQQAEILSKATKQAQRIYEVPITYQGRTYDEGKKIRAHHVIPVIWTIFRRGLFG